MSTVQESFTKCFHCRAHRKANLQMFVSMILIDCAGQVGGGGARRGGNFTNARVANGVGAVGLTDTSKERGWSFVWKVTGECELSRAEPLLTAARLL